MKQFNRLGLLAIATTLLALGQTAGADEPLAGPAAQAAQPKAMSPEERKVVREQMREKWQKMSPEEKAATREEVRQRRENMTLEQREAMKQRFRGHRQNSSGGAGPN